MGYIKYKKVKLELWDLDGKDEVRPLWRHYLANTQYVCFIVDATDWEHIEDAKQLLHATLASPLLTHASLLVFGNKQDLAGGMSVQDMERLLELDKLTTEHHRYVCICMCRPGELWSVTVFVSGGGLCRAVLGGSAETRDGVLPCLEWIEEHCRPRPADRKK